MPKSEDLKKVSQILKRYKSQKTELIGILQDIQSEYTYLPPQALMYTAESLNVPLTQVYSLATFYKAFSLRPRGEYLISLCMGTACHVRGAERILEELERTLQIKAGQTSADLRFSLKTVNCLGACALGPLMVINGEYFAQMNARKVKSVLKRYEK